MEKVNSLSTLNVVKIADQVRNDNGIRNDKGIADQVCNDLTGRVRNDNRLLVGMTVIQTIFFIANIKKSSTFVKFFKTYIL
jgi:hypothetical protein